MFTIYLLLDGQVAWEPGSGDGDGRRFLSFIIHFFAGFVKKRLQKPGKYAILKGNAALLGRASEKGGQPT